MAEIKTYIRNYRIDYLCDDCGAPLRVKDGFTNMMGSKWRHICTGCKKIYDDFDYGVSYPEVMYEDIKKPKK